MCFFPIVVTAGFAFVVCVLMTCSSLVHTAPVPQAPSMSTQRGIIANADSRLREPGGPEQDRHESACAVCARRHWEEDLKPLLLFRTHAPTSLRKMWTTTATRFTFRSSHAYVGCLECSGTRIAGPH